MALLNETCGQVLLWVKFRALDLLQLGHEDIALCAPFHIFLISGEFDAALNLNVQEPQFSHNIFQFDKALFLQSSFSDDQEESSVTPFLH